MNKILKIIFCILLVFSLNVKIANAETNTVTSNDVAEKMKTGSTYNDFIGDNGDILIDSNNIIVVYTNPSTNDSFLTTLYYKDGLLTYEYFGEEGVLEKDDFNQAFMDAIVIGSAMLAIAEINGYTEDDFQKIKEPDKLTLSKNGIEVKTFDFQFNEEDGTQTKGTVYQSFKADMNNFNIDDIINAENTNTNENTNIENSEVNTDKNNNIENPDTGINPLYIIPILLILGLILTFKKRRFE